MQKTSGYKKVWSVFSNFKTIESREKKRGRRREGERELGQELELAKVYVDLHKRFRIIMTIADFIFIFPHFSSFLFVSYDFKRNIYILLFNLKIFWCLKNTED